MILAFITWVYFALIVDALRQLRECGLAQRRWIAVLLEVVMSPEEATWFRNALGQTAAAELSPMLNVGSSTLEYRTIVCPHIEQILLGPLRSRGVRVIHIDMKANNGVDIVGDILDPSVRSHIASLGVKSILCNNLLEHVEDLPGTCRALADICPPGGLLYLSVPDAFPFHPDPIDNGFRASPMQLEEIFTPLGFRRAHGQSVAFGSYGKSIAEHPKALVRDMYLLLLSPFNKKKRRVLLGNYAFLRKSFQVTCAVFLKNESANKGAPSSTAGPEIVLRSQLHVTSHCETGPS